MTTDPTPYDHVRPTEAETVSEGIYRVVGAGDPVVLLRVTDAAGRRANTGEVVRIPRTDFDDRFTGAENPDSGLSPGALVPDLGTYAVAVRYWLPF